MSSCSTRFAVGLTEVPGPCGEDGGKDQQQSAVGLVGGGDEGGGDGLRRVGWGADDQGEQAQEELRGEQGECPECGVDERAMVAVEAPGADGADESEERYECCGSNM